MDLYRRLDGGIPQNKESIEKLRSLFVSLELLNKRFASLSALLEKAKEAGFDDREQAVMHAIVQMDDDLSWPRRSWTPLKRTRIREV